MEVKFDLGYGSNAKTVNVEHGYRCVKFVITPDNGEDSYKFDLPTDQLLAIVKCFRSLETNNG